MTEPQTTQQDSDPRTTLYFPIPLWQFALLSFFSLGIYDVYWFYRNWRFVKEKSSEPLRPFWRAVFAPFFLHKLLEDLNTRYPDLVKEKLPAQGLAAAYFVLVAAWRLPDPGWLVSCFAFAPLIPVVNAINRMNEAAVPQRVPESRSTLGLIALIVIGTPITTIAFTSSLGLTPATGAVAGPSMWASDAQWLVDSKIVQPQEKVVYFYSNGLFSIKEEGTLFTAERLVSYEEAEEGGLKVVSVDLKNVRDVRVAPGDHDFGYYPLLLDIEGEEGPYTVDLPDEGKTHFAFLKELKEAVARQRPQAPPASDAAASAAP